MSIAQGQTAFIKITGEEVFVLEVAPTANETFLISGINKAKADETGFGAEIAIVRHAVVGEAGCKFENIVLFLEELESLEERVEREYNARQRVNLTVSRLSPAPASLAAKTSDMPARVN